MKLLDYQQEAIDSKANVKVLRWARRTGKDITVMSVGNSKKNVVVYPTYKMLQIITMNYPKRISKTSFDSMILDDVRTKYNNVFLMEPQLLEDTDFMELFTWAIKNSKCVWVVGTPSQLGTEGWFNKLCLIAKNSDWFYSQVPMSKATYIPKSFIKEMKGLGL